MKTRILNTWDAIRSTYWFLPSVLALGAVLLSFAIPLLDAWLAREVVRYPDWLQTTTGASRATLAAVAGAMVAVTGTVFSITVVVLSLTSQQFGPRLLRTFMDDWTTQWTLAVFLATGLYSLLALRFVEESPDSRNSPHLSALVAVALAVLSMATLILFIHHISMLIQASRVVESVAEDLDASIVRLFPEKIGEPGGDDRPEPQSAAEQATRFDDNSREIPSTQEGYIQGVDGDGLMALAGRHDTVVRLRPRPGDFLRKGDVLADVSLDDEPTEELIAAFNETVIVGMRRTPRQDVECAVNELVEVAVRSLSPGINDPFTAMSCIDRLGATLSRLVRRKIPSPDRYDAEGRLRLTARPTSFSGVLDAAFIQIRLYGRSNPVVMLRLLDALGAIARAAERDEDKRHVLNHVRTIVDEARDSVRDEQLRRQFDGMFEELERQLSS